MHDVAARAGVAIATVSCARSKPTKVCSAALAKVCAAVRDVG
ncbi:LacI family DNA-binding transcriptional regulator [Paenarthrobacter sp. NPDC089989]